MLTEIVLTEKREDLPNMPYVLAQLRVVRDLCAQLNDARKNLAEHVKTAQENCEHVFTDIKEYDPEYYSENHRGKNVFLGRKCSKCFLFEPRAAGERWQVCHSCGGKMEDGGIMPGQSGRLHVYICENCGHSEVHI